MNLDVESASIFSEELYALNCLTMTFIGDMESFERLFTHIWNRVSWLLFSLMSYLLHASDAILIIDMGLHQS